MEIKMKTVSNIAAGVAALIVVSAFVLKMFGITDVAMSEAAIVGGFVKGVFLPVDASLWIKNSRTEAIAVRDENNA
jgi:uncharacterized MnhB-related membrane protein